MLATNPTFANLTSLELDHCKLGDAGAAALASSRQLQNLGRLKLGANGITAADAVGGPHTFPRLALLGLQANDLPAAARRKLKQRPGVVL